MRNAANVFPVLNEKHLTAIILAAGAGRSPVNRSLIHIGGKTFIEYQIDCLRNKFPAIADIIVVTGYGAEDVYRVLPNGIRSIENEGYATTNNVRSLALGLRATLSPNVLIILGDTYFAGEAFKNLRHKTAIAVDKSPSWGNTKIGVTVRDKEVLHFAYGLPTKWAQIALLSGQELSWAREICYCRENDNLCLFEVFNEIINRGGHFSAIECAGKIAEVNTQREADRL